MKSFFTLLSFCLVTLTISAQIGDDCNCDFNPNDTFVCATDVDGNIFPVPNECFAECFGLTIVEGDCDEILGGGFPDGEYPENDWGCDCEIDPEADFICAADSTGYICPVPNECVAECFGLTVVDDECDDFWGDFPNEDNGDWYGDCDCEFDPEAEWICAADEFGNIFPIESACIAECFGLTVVDGECDDIWGDEDGDWDDEDWYGDCDCEFDPEAEWICAADEFGNVFPIESACIAECFGLTVVDGDCGNIWGDEDGDWDDNIWFSDCDCEIDLEAEWVCAADSTGYICPVPNECVADCYGLTVVEDEDCGGNWEDGDIIVWEGDIDEDCDCEFDEDNPVCVLDDEGNTFPFPNACLAECFGLTIVDCNDADGDNVNRTYVLDKASYAINSNNLSDFNNQFQTSNNTIIENTLDVFPNPVSHNLNYTINLTKDMEATVSVINLAGQMISQQQVALSKGNNSEALNISDLDAGIYYISVTTTTQTINTKFMKM